MKLKFSEIVILNDGFIFKSFSPELYFCSSLPDSRLLILELFFQFIVCSCTIFFLHDLYISGRGKN
jgi:hypothetical protein